MSAADKLSVAFFLVMGENSMKIGFIGVGNMGGAILKGALSKQFIQPNDVFIYDVNSELCMQWQQNERVNVAESNADLASKCDWIVLAVKPVFLASVWEQIRPVLNENKKIISIAAGWSIEMLTKAMGESGAKLLRVMPNTPALVGEGVLALCEETTLDPADFVWAQKLFATLGVVQIVPERLMDAVIAVSGSSPAYVFMFIDAMADAAVKLGMSRKQAIQSAAQAVMGSAKMVLETGLHPAVLKDQVCSPGGTTIEAVQTLEENGMRGAIIKAMCACAEKSAKMTHGSSK